MAPLIDEQLPPPLLHVRHWYVNVIGCVPAHVPGFAVCVAPSVGEPEMVGWSTTRGLAEPWTIPRRVGSRRVGAVRVRCSHPHADPDADVGVAQPVRRTRRTPDGGRSWSRQAAPPSVGQRSQRYANDIGVVPDHVPRFAVSVRPSTASPTMLGSAVLFGGTSATAEPEPGRSAVVRAAAATTGRATRRSSRLRRRGVLVSDACMTPPSSVTRYPRWTPSGPP